METIQSIGNKAKDRGIRMNKIGVLLLTVIAGAIGLTGAYGWNQKNMTTPVESSNILVSGEEQVTGETEDNIIEIQGAFTEKLPNITVDSTMPYYIRINRTQNVVNIYERAQDGSYAPYKAMLCSIGTATPAAGKSYTTTDLKHRWSLLYGNVYGQYTTQIVGGIWFHSIPYAKENHATLDYVEYDKLGTFASHGCVRLTVENSKWVYDNINSGTTVEFYEDEDPGPFGKPELVTISENEACRNWDPSDLEEGNPWRSEE